MHAVRTIDVAIIGGGASGMLLSYHLLTSQLPKPLTIALIERLPSDSAGNAYTTDSAMHLLNVHTDSMGAFDHAPGDFYKWLLTKGYRVESKSFVARRLYGSYLRDLIASAEIKGTLAQNFLQRFNAEATSIQQAPSGRYQITLSSNVTLESKVTVLATGNEKPALLPEISHLSEADGVYSNPWAPQVYRDLAKIESLLIVGSGLSAVDVILNSEYLGFSGSYQLISRHGLFPLPHETKIEIKPPPHQIPEILAPTLRNAFSTIKSLCRASSSWQMTLDSLRPQTSQIWRKLSLREKERFLRHLRAFWDIHRHRIPASARERLEQLRASGRLSLSAGRIRGITKDSRDLILHVSPRNAAGHTRTIRGGRMVVCTGPGNHLSSPLFHSMEREGLLIPHPTRLGPRISQAGELISASGHPQPALLTIGPVRRGELWESTAIREIRKQAMEIAGKIVQTLGAANDYLVSDTANEVAPHVSIGR